MQTQYIDQIVKDILTDMSRREKSATATGNISSAPNFEDAFGRLIQEEDEIDRDVMRRIWEGLQETHR
jgi:hypothetical protein